MLLLVLVGVSVLHGTRNTRNPKDQMEAQITWDHLPSRAGKRPETTSTNPHSQLNQQPTDTAFVEELMDWAFTLGHTIKRSSAVSVPGAIALWMKEEQACKECNAFMVGTEFAHFHPYPDYSLHLGLPKNDAERLIEKGWAEWHPLIKRGFLPPNIVMLYAPRNQEEMEVAKLVLKQSYDFAQGRKEE